MEPLGGADISWVIGLLVPALLYWLLARRDTTHVPTATITSPDRVPAG